MYIQFLPDVQGPEKKDPFRNTSITPIQAINICLNLTTMPSQTRRQLMAELVDAGLDDDELDLIRYELEMDLEADQNESDDADMLDSDDDGNRSMATSSTVHDSLLPTTSWPLAAEAPSKPTVPAKRKRGATKRTSPEFVDDGDDGAAGKPDYLSV
jgi:hypothetical protein